MKNTTLKTLVKAVATACAVIGLSACGGGSGTPASDTTASASATVNDSLVEGASVSIEVIIDTGASVIVSVNPGTSDANGQVNVNFDIDTLKSLNPDFPVFMIADKTLASGQELHFETHLGSVADVLAASSDGLLDMVTEGAHGEISNTGMAKSELMRSLVAKQMTLQGSALSLDQLPSDDLYSIDLWSAIGTDMSEAVMLVSIAVKTIVDYDATIDITHVADYDADGSVDTQELAKQIADDVVSGAARSLDYYIIPDAASSFATIADIMMAIQADVANNPTDPIFSYSTEFSGQGDFATSDMATLLTMQANYAEAVPQVSTLDCTGITVSDGNVYTVTLARPDSTAVQFAYTAVTGDTSVEVASGLQALIDADANFTVTVATDVVSISSNETGLAFQISISAVDASSVAITDFPSFDLGSAVMQDWSVPTTISDYMTGFESILSTFENNLTGSTTNTGSTGG